MIRVYVICEGQTEVSFIKNLLQEDFSFRNIDLRPALVGKPGRKGGNVNWDRLFLDVRNFLCGDKSAYCTTLFDYYGLPEDFPGKREGHNFSDIADKSHAVKDALNKVLAEKIGNDAQRFIPYVQMYEFEGLLFSDPTAFARGIDRHDLSKQLTDIRNSFTTPEMINDSPNTAPSKRIKNLVAEYDKPRMGLQAASEIGIGKIRQACSLFNSWLTFLESLSLFCL